ncbi:MAG: hypothetical protein A2149_05025 [Candidatus Schekmanbacteria bacterium RBG_16_38_11]|uniref:Uncharacterized protein n=2 Tax=Candidatus Schekmaniibacteriota TaxID=1817811 RepID=A0A1F7RNF2_9BACT|nr:MAG: hypothetical protein A2042_08215 [Candidatus Schekmanbacteria bacterium GWA2_38_11]OGL46832.1 MAG: hypothetical protein A2149_05025 [Candidatus Schekmanbacteria bacterium RBG_16_38_11]
MHIENYSFGTITVDGKVYERDLIIFPDKIKSGWWRKEGHSLLTEDLDEVLRYKPEVLIVGRGASNCMEITSATQRALSEKNIKLFESDTYKAVQLFNELTRQGKNVVGAFHLTC